MAIHTCVVCGELFEHNLRGRPPTKCELHRDVKVPRASKTSTADDKVIEALRNAIAQLMDSTLSREDVDGLVKDRLHNLATSVDTRFMHLWEQVEELVKKGGGERKITIDWSYDSTKQIDLPANSHEVLPDVLQCIDSGLNVFLVGPAGSGKSTIAEQVAELLQLPFASMSVGPNTSNTKMFGYMDANGHYITTPFRKVFEGGGVFLLDEMDNGHPGLLAELNQMLAGSVCAFADGMVTKHKEFRMIATGNTFGRGANRQFVGRNVLDAATLDRFATIECPIDESLELAIAMGYAGDEESMRDAVRSWVKLVQGLRASAERQQVNVIISPRASIDGAKLIRSGMDVKKIADIRLWAGIQDDVRKKIESGVW